MFSVRNLGVEGLYHPQRGQKLLEWSETARFPKANAHRRKHPSLAHVVHVQSSNTGGNATHGASFILPGGAVPTCPPSSQMAHVRRRLEVRLRWQG